jgi:hypothetical protein
VIATEWDVADVIDANLMLDALEAAEQSAEDGEP